MAAGEFSAPGDAVSLSASGLAALYEEHVGRAIGLAYLLTGDRYLAEDIAHDAFLRAAGRFKHLREQQAFASYLRKTVLNMCTARSRWAKRQQTLIELERKPVGISPDTTADDRDELWPSIKGLPYRQRAALVLRYWGDMSEDQIAHELHTSRRAVNALLSRAMEALRREVGRNEG